MKMRSVNLLKHTYNAFLSLVMVFYGFISGVHAQLKIRDQSMVNQQERMVFKSWDREKFTPAPGFLGLNPYYWLTWGLHPNYPKTDLRPLSPSGPETIRLGLSANMQRVDRDYELGSDTLNNVALDQITSYSGLLSNADPLWVLYYSKEMKALTAQHNVDPLAGLSPEVARQLVREGSYDWYISQRDQLAERLEGSRRTNQDRGSRILSYHRLLLEYRKLLGIWSGKTAGAARMIRLKGVKARIRQLHVPESASPQSDNEVAKKILAQRKY